MKMKLTGTKRGLNKDYQIASGRSILLFHLHICFFWVFWFIVMKPILKNVFLVYNSSYWPFDFCCRFLGDNGHGMILSPPTIGMNRYGTRTTSIFAFLYCLNLVWGFLIRTWTILDFSLQIWIFLYKFGYFFTNMQLRDIM